MLWMAKNGSVPMGDTDMDYAAFGKGAVPLVMIPGVGDGLTTVKGMAAALALSFRAYAKDFRVYAFSRKNRLEEGCSTKDMAADLAAAMDSLGIQNAMVVGISQGGMIAQYLAIDYPHLVRRLVLVVTLPGPNPCIRGVVSHWLELAKKQDFKALMIDTAEKSYSERYLKRYRRLYPLLGIMKKPKDYTRFIIQATSCAAHNAAGELDKITCPTLIIGGAEDKIIGPTASAELSESIKGSRLIIYPNLGHGAYEEAKDFNDRVMEFLLN